MINFKRCFALYTIIVLANFHSVYPSKIDSLQNLLKTMPDSSKANIYIALSKATLVTSQKKSDEYARNALDIAAKLNDKKNEAVAYSMLGMINQMYGDPNLALDYHLKAYELYKKLGDYSNSFEMVFVIASQQVVMANYVHAIDYIQESYKIAKENGLKNVMPKVYSLYGQYYMYKKDYAKSLIYLDSSIYEYKKLGMLNLVANAYMAKGITCFEQKDTLKGIETLETGLDYARKYSKDFAITRILFTLGNMYHRINNLPKARNYFVEALDISHRTEAVHALVIGYAYLAEILMDMKDYNGALKYVDSTLVFSERENLIEATMDAYDVQTRVYQRMGKFDKAFESLAKYHEFKDSLNERKVQQTLEEIKAKYEGEKKDKEIQVLKRDNEIKNLQLSRKNTLIYSILAIIILIIFGAFLVIGRRDKIRKEQSNRKLTEWKLQALRLQMNPHFIFNVLNSIHYLIDKDKDSASIYLTKISKLMRMVLENSVNYTIALSEEIEILKLYIELEKMRFDNDLEFEIKIDNDIDPVETLIPTMIVQPYVENAIHHGLMLKHANGKVSVHFSKQGEMLKISVEDNGIGRVKSLELKTTNAFKRKSLGMSVTRERLELLNSFYQQRIIENVIDLYDDTNAPIGTKIEIILPEAPILI